MDANFIDTYILDVAGGEWENLWEMVKRGHNFGGFPKAFKAYKELQASFFGAAPVRTCARKGKTSARAASKGAAAESASIAAYRRNTGASP